MKPLTKFLRCILVCPFMATPGFAATLVIDTFDDGPFTLSNDKSSDLSASQSGDMLGGSRLVGISTSRRVTTVTAEIVVGSSLLSYDNGDGPTAAGQIRLVWNSNPVMNLLGYDAFVLSFPSLEGTGTIHIGINETSYGSSSTRIPVSTSGDIRIPMDQVNFANGDLGGVSSIQLVIYGSSPDFKFTMDEIRIVPEASTSILLMGGILSVVARRKRESDGGKPGN